jgi:hypothetical protein
VIKGILGKKGVTLVRETRKIILAKNVIDSLIISSGIIDPVVPGSPFEPLSGMRPAFIQTLEILNLSIQIYVIEVPGGLDLGESSITDRITDLGEFRGSFLIETDGQVIQVIGQH